MSHPFAIHYKPLHPIKSLAAQRFNNLASGYMWLTKGETMLSLCDPHGGIIQQFGCESSCGRVAGVCLKGCSEYEHMQKSTKHEFVNAREFYQMVGVMRERYSAFQTDFKQVYLKRYIKEMRDSLQRFEQYILGEFLEKNPLIDIFCKYGNAGGDMFQQVIEDKLPDLEFAEIRCKEVFHLRQFHSMLHRETKEDQEKRILKLLSKIMDHYLRNLKLIPGAKTEKKKLQVFEGEKIEAVEEELEKRANSLDYLQGEDRIDRLIVKLKVDLNQDLPKGKQETTTSIDRFFTQLQKYIEKTPADSLTIALTSPLAQHPLLEKLLAFLTTKPTKAFRIATPHPDDSTRWFQLQLMQLTAIDSKAHFNCPWDSRPQLLDKL